MHRIDRIHYVYKTCIKTTSTQQQEQNRCTLMLGMCFGKWAACPGRTGDGSRDLKLCEGEKTGTCGRGNRRLERGDSRLKAAFTLN